MSKYGKYGKLTIYIPQSVEKQRLLAKEAGWCFLLRKADSDFIDLISKRYDTKKKYSPGFNCWCSSAPVFQWCCSTPQGSP